MSHANASNTASGGTSQMSISRIAGSALNVHCGEWIEDDRWQEVQLGSRYDE